jgi:hypothetical protein
MGYHAHKTVEPRRVFISGRKRGVFGAIKSSYDADPRSKPSSVT